MCKDHPSRRNLGRDSVVRATLCAFTDPKALSTAVEQGTRGSEAGRAGRGQSGRPSDAG